MIRIALLFTLASLTGLHTPAVIVADNLDEQGDQVATEVVESESQQTSEEITKKELLQGSNEPIEVEEVVKDYFKNTPVLVKVAQCESNFRHIDENGEVLRGVANRYDVGVMQINERFHLDRANRLDIDIHTIDGNLEYARYLYEREGVIPWKASSSCWMNQS
jgi:hypothetical protein